jgi:hypothetical protein
VALDCAKLDLRVPHDAESRFDDPWDWILAAIDTVLVCFADMQGRLIGKRVTGHFFVDQGAHEMHACDYPRPPSATSQAH